MSRAPRASGRLAASVTTRLDKRPVPTWGRVMVTARRRSKKFPRGFRYPRMLEYSGEVTAQGLVSRREYPGQERIVTPRRECQTHDRTDLVGAMTASLRAIRLGLRTQLETISGLRAYDVWPATINPPVAIVRPLSGTYHEDQDGSVMYQFEIMLLLQLGNLTVAQEQLDAYIATEGTTSILAALEADPDTGRRRRQHDGQWLARCRHHARGRRRGRQRPGIYGMSVSRSRSLHSEAFAFAKRVAASLPEVKHVLEVGSRDINGSPRPLFPDAASYTGIDDPAWSGRRCRC